MTPEQAKKINHILAERVMGWTFARRTIFGPSDGAGAPYWVWGRKGMADLAERDWNPATDANDAATVIKAMKMTCDITVYLQPNPIFVVNLEDSIQTGSSESMAEAISLAIVAHLGINL